jgi:hypothetical protein
MTRGIDSSDENCYKSENVDLLLSSPTKHSMPYSDAELKSAWTTRAQFLVSINRHVTAPGPEVDLEF